MIIILICYNNIIIMSISNINESVNNNNKEYFCCFICFEKKILNEKKPMKLKTQNFYLKSCSCDGLTHKKCLSQWYDLTKKCPICREHNICDIKILKKHIGAYINIINSFIIDDNNVIQNNVIQNNVIQNNVIQNNDIQNNDIQNNVIQNNDNIVIQNNNNIVIQNDTYQAIKAISIICFVYFMCDFYVSIIKLNY